MAGAEGCRPDGPRGAVRAGECECGNGWEFLAIGTRPQYTDNHPGPVPGASALCKYRAIYLYEDEIVGMWSDTAEIAIPGA